MTQEQRLEYFKSGLIKKFGLPKERGGLQLSVIKNSVTLIHKDLNFHIRVDSNKSQLKNLKFAMTVFELYLDEFYK